MIPANQHANLAVARVPGFETKIAGREIKFFVEQRVVGNVHLPVNAEQRAVGVNDRGGVVINAGGAFLEQRGDDDDLVLLRELLERLGAWAGNFFGQLKILVVFALAEILRAEQFLRANYVRAFFAARSTSEIVFFKFASGSAEQEV